MICQFSHMGDPAERGCASMDAKTGQRRGPIRRRGMSAAAKIVLPSSGFLASLGFLKRLLEVSVVYDHVVGPRGLTLCVSGCRVGGKGHQGEGPELDVITQCTLSWVGD